MINIKNLNNYSKFLLYKRNIITNKAIVNKFAFYINMIIYNITTLISIIAILVINKNNINIDTLKIGKIYLNKMCNFGNNKSMKGGTNLPASYNGTDDSLLYSAEQGTDVQNIQWENNLIRQELGTSGNQSGGCGKKNCSFNKKLLSLVGKILKEHKMKIDKSTKQELINIIKNYVYRTVDMLKLKSNKKKLTLKSMKSILSKSRIKKLLI